MKKHRFGFRTSKLPQSYLQKWGWQRYLLATTGGIFLLGVALFGGSQLYSQARRSFAQLSGEASFSAQLAASESAGSSDSASQGIALYDSNEPDKNGENRG